MEQTGSRYRPSAARPAWVGTTAFPLWRRTAPFPARRTEPRRFRRGAEQRLRTPSTQAGRRPLRDFAHRSQSNLSNTGRPFAPANPSPPFFHAAQYRLGAGGVSRGKNAFFRLFSAFFSVEHSSTVKSTRFDRQIYTVRPSNLRRTTTNRGIFRIFRIFLLATGAGLR